MQEVKFRTACARERGALGDHGGPVRFLNCGPATAPPQQPPLPLLPLPLLPSSSYAAPGIPGRSSRKNARLQGSCDSGAALPGSAKKTPSSTSFLFSARHAFDDATRWHAFDDATMSASISLAWRANQTDFRPLAVSAEDPRRSSRRAP